MVDYVDLHYANMLSSRLELFKVRSTNPYKMNFRCPICNDSQKSKNKTRGWLLERDNSFQFYCHNCGASQSFKYFLKTVDGLAYNSYIAEKYLEKAKAENNPSTLEQTKFEAPKFKQNPLKGLKKISQLQANHPLKQYIDKRKIPSQHHYKLYYTTKFKTWVNSIIPNKFPEPIKKDEPRLLMPFLDKNGRMFGVSARGFDPDGIRYITIMFDESPKIFGLDTVDFNKKYFVVEGAIDSMFLSNAVAMAGADGNVSSLENLENAIFCFDAEPRNKEIHKRIEKIIRAGYSVCIWPADVPGKDINEMVLAGKTDVEQTILNNTYKGLEANLKLMTWRKT
jgi:transcription elongation factor Elf1